MENKEKEPFNVFKVVTQKIVMRLAQGDIPWRKRWCSPISNAKLNYVTRRGYHGVNLLLLEEPGEYLTVKQANDAGGKIRKGEHGTFVFKWIPFIPKDKKEEAKRLEEQGLSTEHLKRFKTGWENVFHLSQTEGLATKIENVEHKKAEKPTDIARFIIEQFLENRGMKLDEKPAENISVDATAATVTVPSRGQYALEEEWYGSIFSALTQALKQMDKPATDPKKEDAVKDELVAEMCSAMCLSAVGLENKRTREDTAAECARWIKEFNRDYRLVVQSAGEAERLARTILEPIIA